MDFMDPKRRRQHTVMLFVGYGLIGVALVLLTIILLFVAYGFGYKNGQVIQNGLLFLSSTPNPAKIYINGQRYKNDTNTQLVLQAGTYNFVLTRSGYRDWRRSITIDGGQVQTYAYPFFFPSSLTTNTKRQYDAAPALVTESLDRRWLLLSRPGSLSSFDVYDMNNSKKEPVQIDLPAGLLAGGGTAQSLQLVAWSGDNTHVLVKHIYDANTEYLLLNRSSPAQSVNLTKTLNLALTGIDLRLSNRKYDQYVVYDTVNHALKRASASAPALQPYIANVLAFATYGDNSVLYATPDTEPAKVAINYFDGTNTYLIRRNAANTTYLLDLATYGGDLYMAVAAASENVAYVYKDPVSQITNQNLGVTVPAQVLRIKSPSYLAFSANAQYIAFENGNNFGVYDAENDQGFVYASPDVIDAPQAHAVWMDGARLDYVSKGQIVVFDYDGQNRQVLVSADARYPVYFDQQYKFLYAFVASAADKNQELLTSTSLRTQADQ